MQDRSAAGRRHHQREDGENLIEHSQKGVRRRGGEVKASALGGRGGDDEQSENASSSLITPKMFPNVNTIG